MSAVVSSSSTIITELENIWVSDEDEWDNASSVVGSRSVIKSHASPAPRHASPLATWQPFFDKQAATPIPYPTPSAGKSPLSDHGGGKGGEGGALVVQSSEVVLDSLQEAVPERHQSFFRQPARRAAALPEIVQQNTNSTNEAMEKLNDQLQALNTSFHALSLDVGAAQVKEEKTDSKKDSVTSKLRDMVNIKEQQTEALKAQLALRMQQVMALENALSEALMANAFVKPEVRTEVREKVVTLKHDVPKYVEKLDEVCVPVYTEVQKIKEVPVETRVTVQVPYEVEKTIEVPRDVLREVPVVQYRMVEVPSEIVTKEKVVTLEQKVPVTVELIKEIVVERPTVLELVREVPISVDTAKEVQIETRTEIEVIKEVTREVPREVIKEVPVPCEATLEIIKEVPVTCKEIVEVPVELRTVEQEIKEIRVTEQVGLVQEKLVYVPSPQVVKHTEKVVEVVKEVPKEIVRELIVHQPVQVILFEVF